jgi:hypothetical protein
VRVCHGAVGSLLVFESGVAVSVAERDFTVKAGGRASGVGCATRGGPRARQE